jgi:branched-chain amino acid transport system permease protein
MEIFLNNLLAGISIGSVYSLIGMGIIIVYKSSKIFNFAIGGVVAFSSFIFIFFVSHLQSNIFVLILLTMLAGMILGFATERIFLRPMIGQSLLAAIMMTLAISVLFDGIVFLVGKGRHLAFRSLFRADKVSLGNLELSSTYAFIILINILLFLLLTLFFKFTKLGLGMRAAAEDHRVAQSKGIRVTVVFGVSWSICLMICSLCGILLGSVMGTASHMLSIIALKAFPVVLCGGLESFLGCLIIGPLMGIIEIFSVIYLGDYIPWAGFDQVSPYIVMLFIMIFKPEGLFGLKRIERI